jgi:predicted secreted acid phosphatase
MQIGDNIEDFTGITQEDADVEAITEASQGFYVLLPNPMYGSW